MTNQTKTALGFGQELFKRFAKCSTYSMHGGLTSQLGILLDHGFMADRACVWEKSLEGHELAVVARTYCSDEEIDNPPAGLRCVRLPSQVMGKGDLGTPIAVVVTDATPAAEELLSCFDSMPANMLAYGLSLEMMRAGYAVLLDTSVEANFPVVKIVKNNTAMTAGIEIKLASEYGLPEKKEPMDEAVDLICTAKRIAQRIVDGKYPPDRVDSVTWRLADALLVLRDYANKKWPGSPTPGANVPTGRGAMLSRAKETKDAK